MTAYTEVKHGLCRWSITLAIATPTAAVPALSSVGLAASFALQPRAGKLALHSVIANLISELIVGRNAWAAAGLGDEASTWGFV
jgi:hypothetical protein